MTKSTITRERVVALIAEHSYDSALVDALEHLLAAMDSEPAAYTDERNLGYIDRGRETAYLWGKQNSEASDVALYRHAQPVTVVPDKMTAIVKDEAEYVEGWNACRAAMLSGGKS
ncbi:hypothetical protein ACKUPF_005043 [Klebsiella pneumoniae]